MPARYSIIHVGNTASAEVLGLRDLDGAYQNDATVTLESIVDRVSGASILASPLALTYVPASDGDYKGTISHTLGVTAGDTYVATFKAVTPQSHEAQWTELVKARKRTA